MSSSSTDQKTQEAVWRKIFEDARRENEQMICDGIRDIVRCKFGTMDLQFFYKLIREKDQARATERANNNDHQHSSGGSGCFHYMKGYRSSSNTAENE